MTRRDSTFVPTAVHPRAAITLAAAMALASSALAQPATSQAVDWPQRIRDALVATGTLDGLRAELAAAPADAAALQAATDVALESGELTQAVSALEKLCQTRPNDAAMLLRLARVQELAGRTEAARQTLAKADALLPAGDARHESAFRLAALDFDAGRGEEAVARLKRVVADNPSAGMRAGLIASFYGRYADAVGLFGTDSNDIAPLLLRGNAALKAGLTDAAAKTFATAEAAATKPYDRTYAIERSIATARQQKTLSRLADAWLADPQLAVEKALPLATVLRELDRVGDLLAWWKAAAVKPAYAEAVLTDRFVNEVIGAARAAGLTGQVRDICRDLLEREPASWQWLTATVRAELALEHNDEADALMRRRLQAVGETPESVRRLGRLARDFGRSGVALEAADRLRGQGGANAVAGCLLAASVHDREGDPQSAKQTLADAAKLAADEPAAANEVAAALEGAGQDDQAIALIQTCLKQQPDDALQNRLASLLIKTKRNGEAIAVLETVMRSAASPAVRSQAAQRLLEATAASRTTPDLVRRTQARLDAGHGDAQDLALLVDALLSQKQFDAAVETLRKSPLLDEAAKLRRLSVLFLRNDRFEQAEAALRELAKIDPATAVESQERLASIAIKRKRPDDAAAAIKAIEQRSGQDAESLDRLAGVLNRLGRTADAATLYRRLIAAQPDNADNWLLWSTAMSKTGKANLARRRLLVLCGDTQSDSVFAAASDALLNLNATPEMLRVVRRDAVLRLSQRPAKVMLNHVLADVSDELSDPQATVRATELGIAVSEEERSQRLRQLMDVAAQNGLLDTAIDCGRSLLALGDEFPPQLFLQLAERLLIAGRPDEAAGAFARAAESADPDYVAVQSGKLLEQYDYPAAAYAALRPLQERRDADTEFQRNLAELAETVGKFDEAFSTYRRVLDRLARDSTGDGTADAPDAVRQIATRAMLAAPTADQQQQSLLAWFEQLAQTTLDGPTKADVPPVTLKQTADAFRQAAFIARQPQRADAFDGRILAQWPGARAFAQGVVDDRLRLGRVDAAFEFAKTHGVPLSPGLARYATSLTTGAATQPRSFTVKQAAEALPVLMVNGDAAQAKAVLAGVEIDADATSKQNVTPGLLSPFRTLVMAATALNDPDSAKRFALTWADTFEKPAPTTQPAAASGRPVRVASSSTLPNFYMALVSSSWRFFPEAARIGLIEQMRERLANVQQPQTRATLSLYVLQLSAAVGRTPADAVALGTAAVPVQSYNVGEMVSRVFAVMPVADRPAFLRAITAAMPENRRLAALLAVVAKAGEPFDAATRATLVDLAASVPAAQALDWGDWFVSRRDAELLRQLAENAERSLPDGTPGDLSHAAARAALAAAWANAGDSDKADAVAAEALASLAAYAPPSADAPQRPIARPVGVVPDPLTALRVTVAAMSTRAKSETLAKLRSTRAWTQADESWQAIQQAVLLDATGERGRSLATLRQALDRDPNHQQLVQLYKDRLKEDGREAELATLAPRLAGGGWTANVLRQDVTAALRTLGRWREVPTADTPGTPKPIDLPSALAAGDTAQLAVLFRGVLMDLRNGLGMVPTIIASDAGGLAASPAQQPPVTLDAFVAWPGMADEALRTLHAPTTVGPAADWLAALVTRVAKTDAAFRDRLLASLQQSREADALSSAERTTVGLLAQRPDLPLPQELFDTLWPAVMVEPAGSDMTRLAEALAVRTKSSSAATWADYTAFSPGRRFGPRDVERPNLTPLDAADDARLSSWLAAEASRDAADAARQYDALQTAGRVTPRMIATRLVGARLLAEHGDLKAYETTLNSVLHDWAWQTAVGRTGGGQASAEFDLALALPTLAKNDPERGMAAASAVLRALDAAAVHWPGNTDLSRAYATAGNWAFAGLDAKAAESFLEHGTELASRQGPGEHRLWAADLARRLGRSDAADAIEERLLADRCLPRLRINSLLARIRASRPADADRLTHDLATYLPITRSPQAVP